jgi:NADP-dependent 3-hydroxy acid dehydrogenase YdfG
LSSSADAAGDLGGKVAVITGASRGIGAACARALAAERTNLALLARSAGQLDRLAGECRDLGVSALPVSCDVAQAKSVEIAVAQVLDAFGRIDVLINNAGVGYYKRFMELTEAEWDEMYNVNLKGAFLVLKNVIPHMAKARSGLVIGVSSIRGFETIATTAGYSATKFGFNGLHLALAQDMTEYGVRVCVICPGGVRTNFRGTAPEAKDPNWLSAEEVARAVVYCARTPYPASVAQLNLVSALA